MKPVLGARPMLRNGLYLHHTFRHAARTDWKDLAAAAVVLVGIGTCALVAIGLLGGAVWLVVDVARRVLGE